MRNFSFLACSEVTEKFVVGGWVEDMATMFNLNPIYIELSRVALSWSWVMTIKGLFLKI